MTDDNSGRLAPLGTEFRIGSVISRSFSVLLQNIAPFFLLAVIFSLPSQFELFFPELSADPEQAWIPVVAAIVAFLAMNLLTATIVYGTILQLRGGHASVVDCVVKGIGLLLPVIAVSILAGLLVGIAAMLLIVPGLIVFTILWVAIPAAVVEKPGIIGSLRRSAELTKGYRWPVFGVIIIILAITIIINAVIAGPVIAFWIEGSPGQSAVAGLVLLVVQSLTSAFSSVTVAVGYHDLRIAKEGGSTEQIAAVFD